MLRRESRPGHSRLVAVLPMHVEMSMHTGHVFCERASIELCSPVEPGWCWLLSTTGHQQEILQRATSVDDFSIHDQTHATQSS